MRDDNLLEKEEGSRRPVVLLFLDGFGIDIFGDVNAISTAKPKFFYSLVKDYPIALLKNSSSDPRKRYWSLGTGEKIKNFSQANTCLSKILAENNLRHLKISSAYNFTYLNLLFNNFNPESFPLEEKLMVGQERLDVFSDAKEIIEETKKAIDDNNHDFITVSLPILDQLSANYSFKQTVKGVKLLDEYIRKISQLVLDKDAILLIVSPFGNAEYTKDLSTDWLNKEPTNNPVPFLLVAKEYMGKTIGFADPLDDDLSLLSPIGGLDVFLPTVLKFLNIEANHKLMSKSLI